MGEEKIPAAVAGAGLKDIEFNPAVGEERTEKIEVEGYKPFEITFRVPGGAAEMEMAIAARGGAFRGSTALKIAAAHLVRWTLPQPVSYAALDQMKNTQARSAIIYKIFDAGEQAKNLPSGS
jgi:hypothetical protein